jgi:hypothetical protein
MHVCKVLGTVNTNKKLFTWILSMSVRLILWGEHPHQSIVLNKFLKLLCH